MFTGLIREIGVLRGLTTRGDGVRLAVTAPHTASRVAVGDSIAVNGICLTVVDVGRQSFSVEAAAETRRLTTLARWRRGRRVHLEPALRMSDPLDGHLMQGHVDGTGRVLRVRRAAQGGQLVTIALAPELATHLTAKGSVAVDGVSLTVDAGPFRDEFTVNLIPHTLQTTTFADLRTGMSVNLEMDVLVKAARTGDWRALSPAATQDSAPVRPALTRDRLRALGFARSRRRG